MSNQDKETEPRFIVTDEALPAEQRERAVCEQQELADMISEAVRKSAEKQ